MSIAAITWVSRLPLKPSSVKFVLFGFADCANEMGICFPSIEHLCSFTSQDRKTVISGVAKLEELGYLHDTGERRGRTSQVKVYALKSPEFGTVEESQTRAASTVPNSEPLPPSEDALSPEEGVVPNSTVFPSKESQTRAASTVPNSESLPPSEGAVSAEESAIASSNSTVFPSKESQARAASTVPNSESLPPSKGTVSPAKSTVPPSNSTVFPLKESQKRYTEPSGNRQEPSLNLCARDGMELVKTAYPKFAGRQDWINAELACNNRIEQDGQTWDTLVAAAERYAKHIRAKGSEGTQFVMAPGKFFSAADRPWLQDWPIPVAQGAPASAKSETSFERDWRRLRDEASSSGFHRQPREGETLEQYRTALKLHERAQAAEAMKRLSEAAAAMSVA